MKVLFVTPNFALTPNGYGGASALAYSHLELLAHSRAQLALAVIEGWGRPDEFRRYKQEQPEVWERVQRWVGAWAYIEEGEPALQARRSRRLLRTLSDPLHQAKGAFGPGTVAAFQAFLAREKPDLLWAEHWRAAVLAVHHGRGLPVIYGHHDWNWRLRALRRDARDGGVRERYLLWLKRRAEELLVRQVAGCVSGSVTELATMRALGVVHAGYFPTTSLPVELNVTEVDSEPPRLIHLGTMQATASREGLQRFLDVVWPHLASEEPTPQLWLIGETDAAPSDLRRRFEVIGARCTGYVERLNTVLRPYDPHVIAWEHDTGTRTRVPIAFNHAQVLVATRAAVASMPEACNGENCMLVERLDDMPEVIRMLLRDAGLRRRLGNAGRRTFLEAFTREAMQPRFDTFLYQCSVPLPQQEMAATEASRSY